MEERKKDLEHIKSYTYFFPAILQEEDELHMKRDRHVSDVTETTIKEK